MLVLATIKAQNILLTQRQGMVLMNFIVHNSPDRLVAREAHEILNGKSELDKIYLHSVGFTDQVCLLIEKDPLRYIVSMDDAWVKSVFLRTLGRLSEIIPMY